MRSSKDKKKFLEELAETPIILVVCRRTKISKATIYRWRNDDKEFNKKVEEALRVGREGLCDMAESQLLKAASRGERWAVMFLLENNSSRYIKPRAKYTPTRTIETIQIEVVSPKKYPVVHLKRRPPDPDPKISS
jgi:hypothetical protein